MIALVFFKIDNREMWGGGGVFLCLKTCGSNALVPFSQNASSVRKLTSWSTLDTSQKKGGLGKLMHFLLYGPSTNRPFDTAKPLATK